MKPEQRAEARRLRQQEGLPITEIGQRLGVAKSSVSLWVRDIVLTPEQQAALQRQRYAYRAQTRGAHTNAIRAREQRRAYQEEGRRKAREGDPLHLAGCMLYWGEGAKKRNSLQFSNADADMLRFFVSFLKKSLQVDTTRIVIRVFCYLGNGFTLEEIEMYWLFELSLSRENLAKSVVNTPPSSSRQQGRKLRYGTCEIAVHETKTIQHVLGAIQEYAGIEKPEWLG